MANYKKRKVKQSRRGADMLCHPSKNSHNKTADRMKNRRVAFQIEEVEYYWGQNRLG